MQPTGSAALGVHQTVDGRHTAVVMTLQLGEAPDPAALLSDWIAGGWTLDGAKVHGNGDRGAVLQFEQRGSTVAKQRALVNVEKNKKRHRITARTLDPADSIEPEKWKWLDAWIADGWKWTDITGNVEHSGWMFLERDSDEGVQP
jgi:hypothetical protein